ncbi:MAG TPA: DUF1376 domain-containing protein [Xanthomonadaceae bacterium]|jgi:uncharacterized protein YdaU (DUF1376 family)|nr:DUF1376 domain-containing protein [Xanthomonadaceae bacterium]
MAELPFLPIKVDALLADTTHLSTEEFGAYCRLLFSMWLHGGRVVDDDGELAAIVGLPLTRWLKMKQKVLRPMTRIGGTISQKRLTDTWLRVQDLRKKKSQAAMQRWAKQRSRHPVK